MAKAKGLGRGLDALLGGEDSAAPPQGDLRMMKLSQLAPGKYQPRTQMDSESLQELADSIRAQGLMQPILVREAGNGYEIIAGERRWRAAQLAGLSEVPVLLREVADDAVAAMALIENIQREDLNAIDEAHGLHRLIQEFGMTHEAVAAAVGKSRAAVSNLLRLLNLSRPVQDMLTAGLIEMGHARALLPLNAAQQRELAHEIETKALSVREVERRVARLKEPPAAPSKSTAPSRDTLRLEEALSDALGMTAQVQNGSKGKGKLILHFGSPDALDGLLQRLGIAL
ncbi:MAG: chromosome partitioning protein ParB [Hydrogenophilales bacterium 16-64-46]|nr:MAG: chromosome partitioning protein ParB [Hydrogenophilales bacterium 12-64-13]OYZ06764.1 MAG: chromosome partitioning protein ParB [Hydrogenophilales bacterium 16-64-46]OZA39472.1 MAG: chromosome partitioning protein ParB [Hydrogenophilales bacterium 17-64-34]HQT01238.1 ParB/RepB/Spo0J family partition protein [Thiobacillus sp.]